MAHRTICLTPDYDPVMEAPMTERERFFLEHQEPEHLVKYEIYEGHYVCVTCDVMGPEGNEDE